MPGMLVVRDRSEFDFAAAVAAVIDLFAQNIPGKGYKTKVALRLAQFFLISWLSNLFEVFAKVV